MSMYKRRFVFYKYTVHLKIDTHAFCVDISGTIAVHVSGITYLTLASSGYHTRGHSMKLQQPTTRIDCYLCSFFPSSIKIWNALPEDVVSTTIVNQFKNKLAGLD